VHEVDTLVKHRTEQVNGIHLHWVEAGTGPLVVLLHGFPEFWYSWRHQIPALVEAGYRVVAPDMRGYADSDKPAGYDEYLGGPLSADVVGLIEACEEQRATVVGHDWGGAVAWMTALRHPEVVDKLVILNSPHPGVFLREVRNPAQILRSSYMMFFQTPILPERMLSARSFGGLKYALRAGSQRVGAFTDSDLERYAEAFAKPGALTGGLAYYRAMGRRMLAAARQAGAAPAGGDRRTVVAPTLVIWGRNDPVLGQSLADPGERVPNRRVEFIDEAAHFVQADAPERVNELLIDFLDTKPL
jgi:pimeloyl-ACP methyl ester carboxylesterase